MLSNCFEDIWNVKGASGQGNPRRLQFPRRNLDPPAPIVADEAPAPVDPPLQDTPVTVPAGEVPPSSSPQGADAGAGAGPRRKKKK